MTATKKRYRATYILDTRNYTDPVETLISKITENLAQIDITISQVDNLGQKEFARAADRNFPACIYVEFLFEATPEAVTQIQERFRLDRQVNRIFVQTVD